LSFTFGNNNMSVSQAELAKQKLNDRRAIIALLRVFLGLTLTCALISICFAVIQYMRRPSHFEVHGMVGLFPILFWAPSWVVFHVWLMRSKIGRYKSLIAIVIPSLSVSIIAALIIDVYFRWWDKML